MKYFVVFSHERGTGSFQHSRKTPFAGIDEINALEREICKKHGFSWVIITNVQRFPL